MDNLYYHDYLTTSDGNSIFYHQQTCHHLIWASEPVPEVVDIPEWRSFWVSYDYETGHLQVGREGEPAVMATTDSDPINVKYLGYGSGSPDWYYMYDWEWDEGYFRFCYEGTTLGL